MLDLTNPSDFYVDPLFSLFPSNTKKAVGVVLTAFFCDPGEARTLDPMIKSHLLYQLSYGVIVFV